MDASKVAANLLLKWPTKETVKLGSLWEDKTLASQEISVLEPKLREAGVRLAGVGLEATGVEEFVQGQFWKGELYLDESKKTYKELGFKRFSIFSLPGMLLSRVARLAAAKGRERGVGGDLKGDGFQNGGLLIVQKGGSKVLYSFIQENPAEHASNEDILKALNLSVDAVPSSKASPTGASCDNDTCSFTPAAPKETTCDEDTCTFKPKSN